MTHYRMIRKSMLRLRAEHMQRISCALSNLTRNFAKAKFRWSLLKDEKRGWMLHLLFLCLPRTYILSIYSTRVLPDIPGT